jgi:ABC-type bacteriocin/lantibiotic exporter with double-glycine peptidase domain
MSFRWAMRHLLPPHRRRVLAACVLVAGGACYRPDARPLVYVDATRLTETPYFEGQRALNDCGVAASVMLLRLGGKSASYDSLVREVILTRAGMSLAQMQELLAAHQLRTRGVRLALTPGEVSTPLIAWLHADHHVVVLEALTSDSAVVSDPAHGRFQLSRETLLRFWDGTALVPMQSAASMTSVRRSDTAAGSPTRGQSQ